MSAELDPTEVEQAKRAAYEARQRMGSGEASAPSKMPWLAEMARLASVQLTPEHIESVRRAEDQRTEETRRREARKREAAFERSVLALPARYRGLRLDSPELASRVANPRAIEVTRRMKASPSFVWLGLSGSGKTSLACAAAREWLEEREGATVRFARAGQLAVASRYHSLGEGQPKAIWEAINADLLILDELGARSTATQWTDVEDVVFARYEQDVPTWVTTWMTADAVAKEYGDGFARRVFERAIVVDCGGDAR